MRTKQVSWKKPRRTPTDEWGAVPVTKSTFRLMWPAVFAAALGMGLPAAAHDNGWSITDADIDLTNNKAAIDPRTDAQIAQFALPKKSTKGKAAPALPQVLNYAYTYGAEFEMPYYHNRDLNSDVPDDELTTVLAAFGNVVYRPYDWLELNIEATLEKIYYIRQEETTVLPDGSTVQRDPVPLSLAIDLLTAKVKVPDTPVEVTFGRRGYLEPRLWLYDVELDGVHIGTRLGDFSIEASVNRLEGVDLDLLKHVVKEYTNNYIFYTEYRGIEDHKVGGYFLMRDHNPSAGEGRPQFMGASINAIPSDALRWWAQLGYLDGRDEDGKKFSAYGLDAGGTYRFIDTWLQPSLTLHFAYGSGDQDPTDNENNEYRQTGLQSNESIYGGVQQFIYYGETLNVELSNLQIYTIGSSIRPTSSSFVDLVYHYYRLNTIVPGGELRGQELTTTINDDPSKESKDVGQALDLIVSFHKVFGVRGLGLSIRAGVFFPGDAYDSTPNSDTAYSALAVVTVPLKALFF